MGSLKGGLRRGGSGDRRRDDDEDEDNGGDDEEGDSDARICERGLRIRRANDECAAWQYTVIDERIITQFRSDTRFTRRVKMREKSLGRWGTSRLYTIPS